MQKIIQILILATFFVATSSAETMRELPVSAIGFIGPGVKMDPPESAVASAMGSKASVAFPVSNRSLVIDLGEVRLVHQVNLFDNLRDNSGTSPLISKYGLELYTSHDGRHFVRYEKPFEITIEAGRQQGVFEKVRIESLTVLARYIKLHAELPSRAYDFVNSNLQQMVRVYQDPGLAATLTELQVDRYVADRAAFSARIEMPGKDGSALWLEVLDTAGNKLARLAVPKDGEVRDQIDVSSLKDGPQLLKWVLQSEKWGVLSWKLHKIYKTGEILINPKQNIEAKAGQVVMFDQFEGAWGESGFVSNQGVVRKIRLGKTGGEPLQVALPVKGWYAVSIGLIDGSQAEVQLGEAPAKRVKLQVWRQYDKALGLGEALVGVADLNASKLTIRAIGKAECRIAFVRLLALSAQQIQLAKAVQVPNQTGRVTINNDGFSMFYSGVNSKEELFEMVDKYRGKRLYSYDYCLGSDATCTYDTKVGTVFGSHVEKFWRQGDRRAYEGIKKLITEGNDPLRVVIDRCRSIGQPVHVSFRMNANYAPPNAKTMNGRQYWDNYDCRILNSNKKYSYRLSYAYPQVREYRLAVIKEGLTYGPDGLNLDFLRHPPFVGFDPPLVEAFKKRYGLDAFKNPNDPRWLAMQVEVMTGFVRSVRQVLDEESKRQGRKMTLTVAFDYSGYQGQALDVQGWVKEGLVDQIIPGVHGYGGSRFSVTKFAQMVKGTDCQLFVRLEHTIKGHDPTPESERGEEKIHREHVTLNSYRRRVLELYGEGAEGIYLFNNSGLGFIDVLSDKNGLYLWDEFEQPLIGWFEVGKQSE
ncbi:MAG: family 10 glycosylhydrolase [Verrucomicrobiota bacterium]